MSTTTRDMTHTTLISGVMVPDGKLAREATALVRDTEPSLLFNHSTRVYYFGSLAGRRQGLKFDPEMLYIAAMFHDMGLTPRYSSKSDRFEVDGANAARGFLRQHNISQPEIDLLPAFRTKLSMISANERGSGYVEDQAHRGADYRGAETTGSGT